MTLVAQALLDSWSVDPVVTLGLAAAGLIYFRGWKILHRLTPALFPSFRLVSFLAGLLTLWLTIDSPIEAFADLLLSAHMVQHLLLLMVIPPLVLLGFPFVPLLRGLPRGLARDGIAPFLNWPVLRRVAQFLTTPIVCGLVMVATLCLWHVPSLFELTLRSPGWHKFEHICFLSAALLFWWPVVRPFPYRPRWPLWSIPLYLLAADMVNTALSAILTFSDHVLYPTYAHVPQLFAATALSDQATAGVIMWVPGSLAFMIPAVVIAIQLLSPSASLVRPGTSLAKAAIIQFEHRGPPHPSPLPKERVNPLPAHEWSTFQRLFQGGRNTLPLLGERAGVRGTDASERQVTQVSAKSPFDLLTVPVLGKFLRSRTGRRTLQFTMLLLAIIVVIDGVRGPQSSSVNLAGVLPWNYWRAFAVLALLAAGNFFCMACPFTLARDLGLRVGWRQRPWPRALRSKWFAITLLVLFFCAYEVFGLWDKPIWTAWLILNYFLVAFAVDALFRGASFCKYVCPIGQFQFITSLVSPFEVKVRSTDACASCKTHDCLRGNQRQTGCGTHLYLPRKSGNLDCTFCLDCVRACPHDNIGLIAVSPGMDVANDSRRSSIGRFSRRLDIAALALIFVFAAFVNAAFMTAPVASWRDNLAARLGIESNQAVTGILLLTGLVLVPAVIAVAASRQSAAFLQTSNGGALTRRRYNPVSITTRELFCRFSMCLVPLGAAMWAAHFLFHLDTGWTSGWVAFQRAAQDIGLRSFKASVVGNSSPLLSADALLVTQTLMLDAGLLLAIYLGWRVARVYAPRVRDSLRVLAPWAGVTAVLFGLGIWIFLQPMQMRGVANSMGSISLFEQHAIHVQRSPSNEPPPRSRPQLLVSAKVQGP